MKFHFRLTRKTYLCHNIASRSSPAGHISNAFHPNSLTSKPSYVTPLVSHHNNSTSQTVHNFNPSDDSNNVPKSIPVPNPLMSGKSSLVPNGLGAWNCNPLIPNFGVYGSLPFPQYRGPQNNSVGHLEPSISMNNPDKPFSFGSFSANLEQGTGNGSTAFHYVKNDTEINESDKKDDSVVNCQSKLVFYFNCLI